MKTLYYIAIVILFIINVTIESWADKTDNIKTQKISAGLAQLIKIITFVIAVIITYYTYK